MSAEYESLPAMLKPLRTRRKPPNPNQIIFFSDEEKCQLGWKDKQPEWQIAVCNLSSVPCMIGWRFISNAPLKICSSLSNFCLKYLFLFYRSPSPYYRSHHRSYRSRSRYKIFLTPRYQSLDPGWLSRIRNFSIPDLTKNFQAVVEK